MSWVPNLLKRNSYQGYFDWVKLKDLTMHESNLVSKLSTKLGWETTYRWHDSGEKSFTLKNCEVKPESLDQIIKSVNDECPAPCYLELQQDSSPTQSKIVIKPI